MSLVTNAVIILVALLHVYFLVLEMVLWDKPTGLRVFGHSKQHAEATKVLAANQGLYNGFLAAGLIFSLFQGPSAEPFTLFFLLCVTVAGIYGAISVSRKILWVQALPAVLALLLVFISGT